MNVSVLDIFKIGIGPSSSHTVGPMVAAGRFVRELRDEKLLPTVTRVRSELFGSLGATGWGHGSETAVFMGLAGEEPHTVDPRVAAPAAREVRHTGKLPLLSTEPSLARVIDFSYTDDMVLNGLRSLPFHPNGMTMTAWAGDDVVLTRHYYSIGGGFIVTDDGSGSPSVAADDIESPIPFRTGESLVAACNRFELSIPELMLINERVRRPEADTLDGVSRVWASMEDCIHEGVTTSGTLPGGLNVQRRARRLHQKLLAGGGQFRGEIDPLSAMDWVTLWALAVNEENAAGGRVVTAPTNGAAGIVPAVLKYVMTFVPDVDADTPIEFLLTAAAIGSIFKVSASISGAEVGCQGEVGTACAMAAAAMAHTLGGTAQQVVNAAEIGLEHHLGLTCDPVGGLVQIPCIERNAVAAVTAITAARLACAGDGFQHVSLDECIRTMMQTGMDMQDKYKETSRGGLAVNIVEC